MSQPVVENSDSAQSDRDDAVLYDVRSSGVAVLTLNRPERLNAWGGDIARGFFDAIDRAEADPHIRVVVLTGKGRAFCAGANMGSLKSVGDSMAKADAGSAKNMVGERHPCFLTELRKPVIAAINGSVAGIGLTQALFCDIRFAAAGVKFSTAFSRRGLVAEYGISWVLPRLAGIGAATELLLSGRTFLSEEAKELGLVTQVYPSEELVDTVLAYADDMATKCSPASLMKMKTQLYADADLGLRATSERAEALMVDSLTRTDFIEGITSFLEKRPPNFPPLA